MARILRLLRDAPSIGLIGQTALDTVTTADGRRVERLGGTPLYARRALRAAGVEPVVVRVFSGEQLDLAFGRTNVIHAALLAGPASEHALARIRYLVRYRGEDSILTPGAGRTLTLDDAAVDVPDRTVTTHD